jgi:hypothetical protein
MRNQNYASQSVSSFDGNPVYAADFYYTDPHTSIPRGDLYSCSAEITLLADSSKVCQIKTGDRVCLFYGVNLQSNIVELGVTISEAPTITDGSTVVPSVNYNRVNPKTSLFAVFADPTNVSGGTVIKQFKSYSNVQARQTTTMSVNSLYHILKPNTSYSLKFDNGDNQERKLFASMVIMEVQ